MEVILALPNGTPHCPASHLDGARHPFAQFAGLAGCDCAMLRYGRVHDFNPSGEARSMVQTLSTQTCPAPAPLFFSLIYSSNK